MQEEIGQAGGKDAAAEGEGEEEDPEVWIGTGHPPTAKSDVASAIGKTNQQLTNPSF